MRLLLDTRVWLWMALAPQRLGTESRSLLADRANARMLVAQAKVEGMSLMSADPRVLSYRVATIDARR